MRGSKERSTRLNLQILNDHVCITVEVRFDKGEWAWEELEICFR